MTSSAGWRDDYKTRLRTADDAMQLIEDGDLVGLTILAPPALAVALLKRGKELSRMDLRLLSPHILSLVGPDAPNGEKEIELFIGDAFRPSHDARTTTYLPNTFMLATQNGVAAPVVERGRSGTRCRGLRRRGLGLWTEVWW